MPDRAVVLGVMPLSVSVVAGHRHQRRTTLPAQHRIDASARLLRHVVGHEGDAATAEEDKTFWPTSCLLTSIAGSRRR
jgi:hypothetical protein